MHRHPRSVRLAVSVALLGSTLGLGSGCDEKDDDDAPSCIAVDAAGCTSSFDPTFDNVWTQVLEPSCSTPGTSCHAESGAAGAGNGLILADPNGAYEALLNGGFVIPGDPSCSSAQVRMETDNAGARMPLGADKLSEGLRCGVRQWIANGAAR